MASGHCAAARLGATPARTSAAREGIPPVRAPPELATARDGRRLDAARARAFLQPRDARRRRRRRVVRGRTNDSRDDERGRRRRSARVELTLPARFLRSVSATHFSPATEPRVDPRGSNAQHHGATARRASARADSTRCRVGDAERRREPPRASGGESGARALSIETRFERDLFGRIFETLQKSETLVRASSRGVSRLRVR